ncbi:MAG: DNA polymerase III subunit delta [Cellulosilyticaceae bacterium]
MKGIYEINTIQKCYLIHGEEEWIKNNFIKDIKAKVLDESTELMNYNVFEGKEVTVLGITDVCETLPFFSEKKIVVVKNSGLFKTGKKDESEKLAEWIGDIPDFVVLLFCETEVDKRSKLYKQVKGKYALVEAGYPGDEALVKIFMQKNANIGQEILRYFVQNMPPNIGYALSEFEKLLDYTHGKAISKKEIDEICVFSLEQRVFTLIKEVTHKNTTQALKIYKALIDSKESPIGILVLIARQYRVMLQVKYLLKANMPIKQIASEVGLPFFVAKETAMQVEKFSFKQLETVISMCLESDIAIKTGKMEQIKCIEMLIVNCIYI